MNPISKQFEGFYSKPYLCPAGVATIGYGTIKYEDGTKVTLKDKPISEERAIQLAEIEEARIRVKLLSRGVKMKGGEGIALGSFSYNFGWPSLIGSTLMKYHRAGDKQAASLQFCRWVNAGGRRLNGLVKRREVERKYYMNEATDGDA